MALEQEQLFSKEEESILTKHNVVVGDLPDNINRDGIIKNKGQRFNPNPIEYLRLTKKFTQRDWVIYIFG